MTSWIENPWAWKSWIKNNFGIRTATTATTTSTTTSTSTTITKQQLHGDEKQLRIIKRIGNTFLIKSQSIDRKKAFSCNSKNATKKEHFFFRYVCQSKNDNNRLKQMFREGWEMQFVSNLTTVVLSNVNDETIWETTTIETFFCRALTLYAC